MEGFVEIAPLALAAVALLAAGLVAGWVAGKARAAAAGRAAIAAATHALQLELATLDERLRGAEAGAAAARARCDAADREALQRRDELESATHDRARLEERALRVPRLEAELQQAEQARAVLARDNGRLTAELGAQTEAVVRLTEERDNERGRAAAAESDLARHQRLLAEGQARAEHERTRSQEQLELLQGARQSLTEQFKNLANEILEDKSKRFLEQNQNNLGSLLEPLRSRLAEFQGRVEQVYVNETKDRSALQQQVHQLMELNQALSRDAQNLASALKGSAKVQGNWGELILQRVLETAGLRRDVEYFVQPSYLRDDRSRAVPDIVLRLPEARDLVIDSKVSLTAYERHASAASDDERAVALKAHLDSVRSHVRGLSTKNYQDLPGVRSLDFVLAFIPVEPAFAMAVTHDGELFDDAWSRNVLLVSPSTLLFVLRTVAHLWRQEAQSRNAQDIARRGAELYDKLCGFVADLEAVGARLDGAKQAYDLAHKKLSSGKGNAIGQAEKLRDLGIKPSKALPRLLLQAAGVEEADVEEACVDG